MGDLNDYLKDELNDHITDSSGGVWVAPGTLYLCLLKTASASSDTPAANPTKEVQTSATLGYARQPITFGTVSSGGVISNTVAVTFGAATANWDEAIHFWITDTASFATGKILYQRALVAPKTVENLDSLTFAIGEIDLTLV